MSHAKHAFTHIETGHRQGMPEKKDGARFTQWPCLMLPSWGKTQSLGNETVFVTFKFWKRWRKCTISICRFILQWNHDANIFHRIPSVILHLKSISINICFTLTNQQYLGIFGEHKLCQVPLFLHIYTV